MISSLYLSSLPRLHAFRNAIDAKSLSAFVGSSVGQHKSSCRWHASSLIHGSNNSEALTSNERKEVESSDNGNNDTWQNPRSRWARRKYRKKMEKLQGGDHEEEQDGDRLDWNKFEFGDRLVLCFASI